MKSLVGAVFLLLFVLLNVMCCEGCWKQEREALIALSWVDTSTDCCEWEGVECNTTTGRVTKLKLQSSNTGSLNYSDFSIFKDLTTLDLSRSEISNCTRTHQVLKNLEVLDLSHNYMGNAISILSCVDGLSSLKSLSLAYMGDTVSFHDFQTVLETISSKLLHLEALDIGYNNLTNEILPSLRGFTSLKELRLRDIGLDTDLHIQGLCVTLKNLEILDIFGNNFSDTDIASPLSGLSSLKSLNLPGSELTPRSIHNISKLRSLEILDLSGNNLNLLPLENHGFAWPSSLQVLSLRDNSLSNNILSYLSGLPLLTSLDLSFNNLNGSLDISGSKNLSRLDILDLDSNMINGSNLQEWLPAFPSIRNLTLRENKFKGTILDGGFRGLSNLEYLALDYSSNLQNEFFKSIGDLPSLKVLSVLECGINGTLPIGGNFQLPSRTLLNLATIDVSYNAITGQMLGNNISSIFPNLVHLNMSINAIHGSIPNELSHLSSLEVLDLSDNELAGEIPNNISGDGSQLIHLTYLLLGGNSLSGSIPSNLFYLKSIKCLDISNNNFIGKIPNQIKNSPNLIELSMSNNHFEGSIPQELEELESLTYLDLSQNNLSGCVPSFINTSATAIHLSNNKLSCLSKRMFRRNFDWSSPLLTLDLSNNEISNGIHDLIHDLRYANLKFLLMKGNDFTGNIPKQLCHLTDLNILDLSYNNFIGEIPRCLGKMPFENEDPNATIFNEVHYLGERTIYNRIGKERANFTSKKRLETYTTSILIYMSGIDLSHNKLNGSIPSELGNLTRIRALNLSNNFLTGKIPVTFSSLVQVESLDLSFNMLSGRIPPQLTELTSLEVFSVAHNNLSGATPERKGQFITFDESSYEGNQFLCGPPLPKNCNPGGQTPAALPDGLNKDGDDNRWVDMYVFRVSFVVAYTSLLLLIPTVLYINPYWRQAWFYYIGLVCMNCYYFIEDNLYKFF